MRIGVPTELKSMERRVGLTPDSVRELVAHGQDVLVQDGAGEGIGASSADYAAAGATIVADGAAVYKHANLIVKVKEPLAQEREWLRPDHTLFAYLHLAPDPVLTQDLLASGATCIAYETVTDSLGRLPLLAPMSKVAGRMAVQAAANWLEGPRGGAGLLLGGVPGVAPATVVILGGGVVGAHAAEMASGLGARVRVLDRNVDVLDGLASRFAGSVETLYSSRAALEREVAGADVVIGAVLIRGARTPHLVSAEMIRTMRAGSVIVDVAIDQGGCIATSRPTTHEDPTFVVDGVIHYCVANMPGGVPRTSTHALNNATVPFVVELASRGVVDALRYDPNFANGLNIAAGRIVDQAVAEAHGLDALPLDAALAAIESGPASQ